MLLAIDTSTRYAGVCLWDQERVTTSLIWHSTRNHTQELLPAIQLVLDRAGIGPAALGAVAVALGPGGFSSLRVGLSTAKGLVSPLGTPLIGVSTLEMEAYPYAAALLPVCSLLDSGREKVAAAVYRRVGEEWTKLEEAEVYTPEALSDHLKTSLDGTVLICGEGVLGKEDMFRASMAGSALVISFNVPANRLWGLAELGWQRYCRGQFDNTATLQPMYLRPPSISQPNPPRRVRT